MALINCIPKYNTRKLIKMPYVKVHDKLLTLL